MEIPRSIEEFLKKFTSLTLPDESIRKATSVVIKDVCGEDIDIKNITLKNNIVYIQHNNHILRSHIFINKNKILTLLKERVGEKTPEDIRF